MHTVTALMGFLLYRQSFTTSFSDGLPAVQAIAYNIFRFFLIYKPSGIRNSDGLSVFKPDSSYH